MKLKVTGDTIGVDFERHSWILHSVESIRLIGLPSFALKQLCRWGVDEDGDPCLIIAKKWAVRYYKWNNAFIVSRLKTGYGVREFFVTADDVGSKIRVAEKRELNINRGSWDFES